MPSSTGAEPASPYGGETGMPKILVKNVRRARTYADRAISRHEAVTLETHVAEEMSKLLSSAVPIAVQRHQVHDAVDDVNAAARALATILLVPAALDPHRDDNAETARGNIREKLAQLDQLTSSFS